MFRRDIFDEMNRLMANFDVMFRDVEKELGMGNLLPYVTVPATKTYYREQRALDDGEKITYFQNGRVSRLDGPAVIYHDEKNEAEWWLDGRQVDEATVKDKCEELEDEKIHHVSIDGRAVEVKGSDLRKIKEILNKE